MLSTISKGIAVVGLVLSVASAVPQAGNAEKALAEAESRRKAAENGLREIKKKSAEHSEQARASYTSAAANNNAWLDQLCQAIEEGASKSPDAALAATAAASLVEWVAVRNRALDAPLMTNEVTEGVKKSAVQDMLEIANSTLKDARGGDKQKRSKAAKSLSDRLRWKTWEEVV